MSTTSRLLPRQWQDQTIVALGGLLFVSPWLLGYANSDVASWNAWVVGLSFVSGGLLAAVYEPFWPEFVVSFLGFWLALSSRILGFTDRPLAWITAAVIGAVVVCIALWAAIARSAAQRAAAAAAAAPPQHPSGRPPLKRAA